MPLVEFDDSDLLRNKIVPPAWYRLHIESCGEWSPTKAQDSNNCLIETVIVCNADNGDSDGVANVPITLQFNDKKKARGFIEGFLRALGVDVTSGRYDLAKSVGMDIEAFIENNTYEGRVSNRCNHKYRQVKK